MATDPQAVAAAMEVLGCVGVSCWCGELPTCDGRRHCDQHNQPWPAGEPHCPVAVAVAEAVTPPIAARALEDAADDPSLRLQGHSGISIRGLRARAAEIRNQPKETP